MISIVKNFWGSAFKVFLLLLLSFFAESIAFACGWYPEAETYRFVLFNPQLANRRYEPFYFTSYFLYDYENLENREISNRSNIDEWIKYTQFKGSHHAVDYILNYVTPEDFTENMALPQGKMFAGNPFIEHLIRTKNQATLQYLQFAKNCEVVNSIYNEDPWSRQKTNDTKEYQELISSGEKLYSQTKQPFLQFRYGFQLVRLARYMGDYTLGKQLYKKYIEPYPSQSIVYYWAMWHYAEMHEDKVYQNYLVSQVFDNAHDKKVVAWQFFNRSHTQESLKYAKTNHERATILLMNELYNPGRSLSVIKQIYTIDPTSDALETLLIREINKLEDWILTPRYTEFDPAVNYRNQNLYDYTPQERNAYTLKNYKKDMIYLAEVLSFIEHTSTNKIHNPALWNVMAGYLAYMNNQFDKSSNYLHQALKAKGLTKRIEAQAHLIKIVAELNPQQPTRQTDATLLAELEWLEKNKMELYHYKGSFSRLMMALTNRYWEAGDIVRATLCHSKIFDYVRFEHNFNSEKDSISDRYYDRLPSTNAEGMNYYSSYLFFLDQKATPSDIEKLLSFLDKNPKSKLESYLAKDLLKEKDRITDLLGIKYLRENKLYEARDAFKKVSKEFWVSDKESYKVYLKANPFYTNFYQVDSSSSTHTSSFTKFSLTDSLIHIIERAENPKESNRAKWYFLAANCYLNMSYWGNSWIMTRHWWSRNEVSDYSYAEHPYSTYPDNANYYGCERAMNFYLKAQGFAKDKSQKALCLRMAGRCKFYSLLYTNQFYETIYDYKKGREVKNPYYTTNRYYEQLQRQYPDFYEELMFQCTSFDTYYTSLLYPKTP
ncbi:hypothetical protein [Xanthocytophaga agilis]|uniref:Uncharacterized protein n=1 Tax=Xanthocytophaga agilis TaxID=3048010 RepID=A0AAE3R7T7_9BACT|nr:hypothetical protein [Xanthocytophaga agilis]MDJ1502373.1 hypothetical protein [Xanthocytophaga agilis]